MTEEQIECFVERRMNVLDARLLRGDLDQSAYDREVKLLDAWSLWASSDMRWQQKFGPHN